MADEDQTKKDQDGAPATTVKPAEPTDDLVTTQHRLQVGRRTLDYTATTGRVVHMMYVHEPSRLQQSKDLADFVRRCSP